MIPLNNAQQRRKYHSIFNDMVGRREKGAAIVAAEV